jgi:hypothetical protein
MMTRLVRTTVLAAALFLVAAASVPVPGEAGTRNRDCRFIASGKACPCPRPEKARAVVRAVGTAVRVTAQALGRVAAATPGR